MTTPTRKLAVAVDGGARGLREPASSHREAPYITRKPAVDATDFYMFNSYEPGRDYVTMIANYLPLQDSVRRAELLRAGSGRAVRDPRRQQRRRARRT